MRSNFYETLQSSFTAHWSYMALRAACKMDLFDVIQEAPGIVTHLAERLEADPDVLGTLLSHLKREGFVEESNGLYSATSKGGFFTESHPERLKYSCILWGEEQLIALQHLDYTIHSGKSSFENVYGSGFFDYISLRPEANFIYHKAMEEYAREDYRAIPDLIDFSGFKRILDAGGGTGTLAGYVKRSNPMVDVSLLDRPEVLALCSQKDLHLIPGDFFEPVAGHFDAVILARVLHDWDDNAALRILGRVSACQQGGDMLFILENLTDQMTDRGDLLSLHMTAVCKSHERSSLAYQELVIQAGYSADMPIQLTSHQYIIPCTKN